MRIQSEQTVEELGQPKPVGDNCEPVCCWSEKQNRQVAYKRAAESLAAEYPLELQEAVSVL